MYWSSIKRSAAHQNVNSTIAIVVKKFSHDRNMRLTRRRYNIKCCIIFIIRNRRNIIRTRLNSKPRILHEMSNFFFSNNITSRYNMQNFNSLVERKRKTVRAVKSVFCATCSKWITSVTHSDVRQVYEHCVLFIRGYGKK